MLIKQDLDTWLNKVNYKDLNGDKYIPSEFALKFMNFIKLVNGSEGESHKTPPVHLKMLDKIAGPSEKIVNLCFRGAGKTSLFVEYMILYIAVFGSLPGLGRIPGMLYVSDSIDNGVKSARENIEFRYYNSAFLQKYLPVGKQRFTEKSLDFVNVDGQKFGVKMYGARTGLRGAKVSGKRPVLAILDDLISDDDARSKVAMDAIKETVYKGVTHALDPTKRKIIFNGTPFNSEDIIIEAVESGTWDVNVWPVCEQFPCSREDFVGAWPDRFSYDFIKKQYDDAVLEGKVSGFMQELMLRISSEEDRLIQDSDIREYSRKTLLKNKSKYNFYITTDFATSEKQTADYSVISVWAYSAHGDWYWVDGICERQSMDKTIDTLFTLAQEYNPQSVGIEITGQQGAFISWLKNEMMDRNQWFNFASSSKDNSPGIRPTTSKLVRFNQVVPLFKAGKIHFPEELRSYPVMVNFYNQLKLVTNSGIKGKDDCIDTISMLAYLKPWKPTNPLGNMSEEEIKSTGVDIWEDDYDSDRYSNTGLSNYVV